MNWLLDNLKMPKTHVTSRKSYTVAHKLHIVDFAEHNGNHHAGQQFHISEKLVHDWQWDEAQLKAVDKQKRAS